MMHECGTVEVKEVKVVYDKILYKKKKKKSKWKVQEAVAWRGNWLDMPNWKALAWTREQMSVPVSA